MTSALLFVAVLVVVELSYRRWVREPLARRRRRSAATRMIDLTEPTDSSTDSRSRILRMPPRTTTDRDARRSG